MLVALLPTAAALSLSLVSSGAPHAGVTLERYRTASPATDVWVARVDLCHPGIGLHATTAPTSLQSVSSWAQAVGADVAINGDFYRTGPVRVYGRAIGDGVPWPDAQTGVDPANAGEWFWQDYGWIAAGHDRVDFAHTGWTQRNRAPATGWAPGEVAAPPPEGTLALVSGFPQLVFDGAPTTCTSPTASDCFPDRTDMRSRHPRSAMGISADRSELLLVVVDGRTGSASGMYGAELSDLLGQLGAWQAFNLDGGGSSQLWVRGDGTVNNASGNNSGGGLRGVANHIGVVADGTGRPGHCEDEPPCGILPAQGGTIDDDDACFGKFGDLQYWRTEDIGHDGHLFWTQAFRSDLADNWAWWQLHLAQAGTYDIAVWAEPGEPWFDDAEYAVVTGGTATTVRIDLSPGGWVPLGRFDLAAGGDQFVRVVDDLDYTPAGDRRIPGDALRLTRVGGWCGDGTCDGDETPASCAADCAETDTASPDTATPETGSPDGGAADGTGWEDPPGSVPTGDGPPPLEDGCAAAPTPRGLLGLLPVWALLWWRGRTRRDGARPGR